MHIADECTQVSVAVLAGIVCLANVVLCSFAEANAKTTALTHAEGIIAVYVCHCWHWAVTAVECQYSSGPSAIGLAMFSQCEA